MKIIAFDEEDETLAGVKAGAIVGTVVQQPFEFGYQAITRLAKVARRAIARSSPPRNQIFVPTRCFARTTSTTFRTKLIAARAAAEATPTSSTS